jgi:hypothetical protein
MKIYLIGIDQAILPLTRKLVEEGRFPALKRLLEEGAVNQVLPSFPAWTPTNWATIATGADTGTHGVFGWQVAMPSGKLLPSFHSNSVNAESIWEAAERAGLKSAAIHYPASMPPRVKRGIVVDGDGSPGRAPAIQTSISPERRRSSWLRPEDGKIFPNNLRRRWKGDFPSFLSSGAKKSECICWLPAHRSTPTTGFLSAGIEICCRRSRVSG